MKPLLCFDIDGTLRNPHTNSVPVKTKETLKELKRNGYRCIISTGRSLDSLKRTPLLDLLEWDGIVCNNGQLVLKQNGDLLFEGTFAQKSVEKTIEVARTLNIPVVLKTEPRVLIGEANESFYEALHYFNSPVPFPGEYKGQHVPAMILYGPKGYDYEPFMSISGIHVMPGVIGYADVAIEGVSKASGIKKFKEYYGVNEYVAFGDSQNDLEMFKYATLSIAMGNGDEKTKATADYITSDIENGIYDACMHFGYIKKGGKREC